MTFYLRRLSIVFFILLLLPGFRSGEAFFAPNPELWAKWQAHDANDTRTINHSTWSSLLSTYVVAVEEDANLFAYGDVTEQDQRLLAGYIEFLGSVPISTYNKNEQLAYWMNLYNAVTIKVVLDHYPVVTIRDIDISPGLFSDGPWGKELVMVESEALTLNDIEHRILRPIWKDARIHYGVNCASIGCPDLNTQAFSGATVDAQLTAAARDYVNDRRGVVITNGKITVSKIYDWFIDDFGGDEAGVIAHLKEYASDLLRTELARAGMLSDVAYDWSLNGTESQSLGHY